LFAALLSLRRVCREPRATFGAAPNLLALTFVSGSRRPDFLYLAGEFEGSPPSSNDVDWHFHHRDGAERAVGLTESVPTANVCFRGSILHHSRCRRRVEDDNSFAWDNRPSRRHGLVPTKDLLSCRRTQPAVDPIHGCGNPTINLLWTPGDNQDAPSHAVHARAHFLKSST